MFITLFLGLVWFVAGLWVAILSLKWEDWIDVVLTLSGSSVALCGVFLFAYGLFL